MKQFYETYADADEKLSPLLRELVPEAEQVFRDQYVVEYALSRSLSPTMVAEYKLCLPDKKLLRQKMREIQMENENTNSLK